MPTTWKQLISVTCPCCNAPVGWPCHTVDGNHRRMWNRVHRERRAAAIGEPKEE